MSRQRSRRFYHSFDFGVRVGVFVDVAVFGGGGVRICRVACLCCVARGAVFVSVFVIVAVVVFVAV